MYNPDVHHRSSIRLKGHDYSIGRYFITIDVNGRIPLFGRIVGNRMEKNDAAEMVETAWTNLVLRFPGVVLDSYVIMPDHFHGIIDLGDKNNHSAGLGEIIGCFKSQTTYEYAMGIREHRWQGFEYKLWQRNYFENIIHTPEELFQYRKYIENNPSGAWDDNRSHSE